ncbi:MAG TPA: hypothetical protein VGM78_10430, partial [Ilumatobacteraceae bacterium]
MANATQIVDSTDRPVTGSLTWDRSFAPSGVAVPVGAVLDPPAVVSLLPAPDATVVAVDPLVSAVGNVLVVIDVVVVSSAAV